MKIIEDNHKTRRQLIDVLDIDEIAARHNLQRHRYSFICPYHEDKHPSLAFNPKTGYKTFKCFACGAYGSIIDFLGKINGLEDKNEQYRFALQYAGFDISNHTFTASESVKNKPYQIKAKTPVIRAEYHDSAFNYACEQLASRLTLNDTARNYLHKRGITDQTIETYNIKSLYDEKELRSILTENQLLDSGLYDPYEPAYCEYRIPFESVLFFHYEGQHIRYISNRSYNPSAKKKSLYLKDKPLTLFQGDRDMSQYRSVVLLEGIINGLSYYQLTGQSNFYCCMGIAFESFMPCLTSRHQHFVLAFDPDTAGDKACYKFSHPEIYFPDYPAYQTTRFDYQGLQEQYQLSFEAKYDLNDILCGIRKG